MSDARIHGQTTSSNSKAADLYWDAVSNYPFVCLQMNHDTMAQHMLNGIHCQSLAIHNFVFEGLLCLEMQNLLSTTISTTKLESSCLQYTLVSEQSVCYA